MNDSKNKNIKLLPKYEKIFGCIILFFINEVNVEKATLDFVSKYDSDFKILKEIKTANKYIHPIYANGIVLIEKIN